MINTICSLSKKKLAVVVVGLSSFLCHGAFTSKQFKQIVAARKVKSEKVDGATRALIGAYCYKGESGKALDAVKKVTADKLRKFKIKKSGQDKLLVSLEYLANAYRFLTMYQNSGADLTGKGPFLKYLIGSQDRILKLGKTIKSTDNMEMCFTLMEEIFEAAEPEAREQYFDLMLALAVVWDQPRRELHGQIGNGNSLQYKIDIVNRFNYYHKLYSKNKAKFRYNYLDVDDLIFVVDTPVPVHELEWAQENVKYPVSQWGATYQDIEYDHDRSDKGQFNWLGNENGKYTLDNIKTRGGICVDQAYYSTMTARALGIPALAFSGQGTGGGHAWFSFMNKPGGWKLDVGRYESQGYTIGRSTHPQSNKVLSDHDVELLYNRSFAKEDYSKGVTFLSLARLLKDMGHAKPALALAKYSCSLAPLDLECWNFFDECIKAGTNDEKLAFYEQKIKVFRKFPDVVAVSEKARGAVLIAMGNMEEAQKRLAKVQRTLGRKRSDLGRDIALSQVDDLVAAGKSKEARMYMEKLIKSQYTEYAKLLAFLEKYLKVTKETGQAKEAVRFVSPFIKSICPSITNSSYKRWAVRLMVQAYKNNGDQKGAASVEKKYAMN